jgi:hypothetical protein
MEHISTLTLAYIFIGILVWALLTGLMLVHCFFEDITEAEYEALENEQWQRDMDELEHQRGL